MKIAIIANPNFKIPPERYGGTELIVSNLADGLSKRDHDVYLYASGDSETIANLKYTYKKALQPENAYLELHHYTNSIRDIASDGKFDIVLLNGGVSSIPPTRFLDVPCCFMLHFVSKATDPMYDSYLNIHYIALSNSQGSAYRRLNPKVIYHGLDTSLFPVNLKPDNYVCYLGKIAKTKGTHIAINSALRSGVRIRLGGPIKPYWPDQMYASKYVKPLMSSNPTLVEYLGNLNFNEKIDLLKNSKAMLFPISCEEAFGLVMIESMYCGTPVIAFPKASTPEIIEEGVTGFLVRNEDEMANLISSDKLDKFDRKKCSERARSRFNLNKFLDDHESFYKDLIKNRNSIAVAS